ncbi:hypothetical protein Ct9H90mP12_0600 [bacterium]|nr:MAG: hypothetical protein Ct9H90mP12_0600 [bacterium]
MIDFQTCDSPRVWSIDFLFFFQPFLLNDFIYAISILLGMILGFPIHPSPIYSSSSYQQGNCPSFAKLILNLSSGLGAGPSK